MMASDPVAGRAQAEQQLSGITQALAALGSKTPPSSITRRVLSADARKRVSLAQTARWRKQKKAA